MVFMQRTMSRLATGALVVGGLLAALSPAAAASPELDGRRDAPQLGTHAAAPSTGDVGTLSYNASRYGYTGTFRDGTRILDVNWGGNRLESFGIAPDRTIWHAWPGSGHWHEMPHNGRADAVTGASYSRTGPGRIVDVAVNGVGFFCSNDGGTGRWGRWYNCTI